MFVSRAALCLRAPILRPCLLPRARLSLRCYATDESTAPPPIPVSEHSQDQPVNQETPLQNDQNENVQKNRSRNKQRNAQGHQLREASGPSSPANSPADSSSGRRSDGVKLEVTIEPIPHLLTLADLSVDQISFVIKSALVSKYLVKQHGDRTQKPILARRTIGMLFSKRSTRTRVASETSINLLGGSAMFLGSGDIQLGVNETLADSAKVIGSMVNGIIARVGEHEEVEILARDSGVPVINALSRLYHPTQILADLMTLHETFSPPEFAEYSSLNKRSPTSWTNQLFHQTSIVDSVKGKKIAWVGDTNNITNELLVTLPRFGMKMSVASPKGYDKVEPDVWKRIEEAKTEHLITLTNSPAEALKDADVVVTDTWISMGQEEEKASRLEAFEGYQITNAMVDAAGANPDWKFLHCLPRKPEEVDDEVFYGPRSLVFPEAENRKWTILSVLRQMFIKRNTGDTSSSSEEREVEEN